jgi:membrane associated rhomboid family serine protease
MIYPNAQIAPLFLPISISAKELVFFYGLYELIVGMTGNGGADNIAHMAHIGGILIAYIILKIFRIRRF